MLVAVGATLVGASSAAAAVQPYGSGDYGGFRNVLPPGQGQTANVPEILNFVNNWGEYLVARTLTYEHARTLPVAIATLQPAAGEWNFANVTAAYMLMFGPAFVVLAVVQRWFMRGLTEGGIKF